MFRRAMAILAFSVFLTISTTPATPQPLSSPVQLDSFSDLIITDLLLNSQRKLVVTIANIGSSPLPLGRGNLKVMVDGSLKGIYTLGTLTPQSFLPVKGSIALTTPLSLTGRHEIEARVDFLKGLKESNEESNKLKKTLEGLPVGPDIVLMELDLTEDLELMVILSNAGGIDLQKGVTFRIQIEVNERKVCDFEHFISDAVKADFGNRYFITPPYRVKISGISKVKVTTSPKFSIDDISLENNLLERTFVIFPFHLGPHGKEEFSFSFLQSQSEGQTEKMKTEARWEGLGSALKLSFKKQGSTRGIPTLSGRSPLKVEFPIIYDEIQRECVWCVLITNLVDKRVEGHLIIQHP